MKIIQIGDLVLRKKVKEIPIKDITKGSTQKIIKDMEKALRASPVGIGLAAPQIGISKSIFIVSKYVLDTKKLEEKDEDITDKERAKKLKEKESYLVFINPKILKLSKSKKLMHEGCLSVENKYGSVKRSTQLTIEAYDERGKKFKRGAGKTLAHVIQHEMDHLEGVLFVDKAEKMEDESR